MIEQQDEKDLVLGCIRGDKRYQKMLYDLYGKKMYGVCLRYCQNKDVAKDVMQDAFVKILTNIGQFKFTGPLEAWMRRIMVNTSIQFYRNSISLKEVELSEAHGEIWYDDTFSKLSKDEILKLIQNLAPGYRTVFNLYVIEGYSHAEIGEMMGINENTSKSQLFRARVILQEEIKKMYLK
jgi:RNA polymerase sigma-70 factor (ECF subfamily)